MGKNIVLAGGGHAHMTAMINSHVFHEHGHRISLISPAEHHYYSGMGPGMLGGTYKPQDIRFNVKKMIQDRHGHFIQDSVTKIESAHRRLTLTSGTIISYDVLSLNVGSGVPDNVSDKDIETLYSVKPILNLLKARERIWHWPQEQNIRILVMGGGPAGVEIAGNVHRLTMERRLKSEISIIAGTKLLRKFPEAVRAIAGRSFRRRSINLMEGAYVSTVHKGEVLLDSGEKREFDFAFLAWGVKPPYFIHDSGISTDKEGSMLVNQNLQSLSHPEIFGGGDCISLQGHDLEKVGVYAVRQNPVLYHNLMAYAEGKRMIEFDPGGKYLLIFNLGDGTGIFWRGKWVWNGKVAFLLKDYIDNRFMKRFQVSGERNEA